MTGRPHRERLLHSLKEIRDELAAEVARVEPTAFDWAPAESMKSYKALLREIGTMEKESVTWLTSGALLEWDSAVAWSGDNFVSTISDLAAIRAETVAYLVGATEENLQTPTPLPESWKQYFPVPDIEPEELIRWVCQHEYYHLGQIITYSWIRGDNPYKRG